MARIILIFAAVLAGNALALNETPTIELTNNDIREEILPGNVVFDDKSLYSIDNRTDVPVTAEADAPNDVSEFDENNSRSESEIESAATPISDAIDNSTTTESNIIEAEQNEQLVAFTDMLTTKLKQIANDFEVLVDNDKKLVDIGKMTPDAGEKIESEMLREIDTVMGLIPKEIMEAIRDEEGTPVDIEVTISYDDTPPVQAGERTRAVTETNVTAFAECCNGVPRAPAAGCQTHSPAACQLHRNNFPNSYPVHNYNMMSVPLMQARFHPRYCGVPPTTPRVYAANAPPAPCAMRAVGQMPHPLLPQGVRRSHTTTESHNVLTGDAVVTEESRDESEVLRGSVAVHSVHSELVERLVPAQHRVPMTPVQQYYVART